MNPVVLISRTLAGDAFRYSRYAQRESTHISEFEPVPVGTVLPAFTPAEVELLRSDPDRFYEELK